MFKLLRNGDKAAFARAARLATTSKHVHFLQEIEPFHVEFVDWFVEGLSVCRTE